MCSYFQKAIRWKYSHPWLFSSISQNPAKFIADGKRNFHLSYTTGKVPGAIHYQNWTKLSGSHGRVSFPNWDTSGAGQSPEILLLPESTELRTQRCPALPFLCRVTLRRYFTTFCWSFLTFWTPFRALRFASEIFSQQARKRSSGLN